jgi:hypothetical protein
MAKALINFKSEYSILLCNPSAISLSYSSS